MVGEHIRAPVVDEEFIEEMQQYREPANKDMTLFEAASDSPVIFVEKMLGFELYAWEIDFLMHIKWVIEGKVEKNKLAALTSRQIGKTFCIAAAALWACIFNKKPASAFETTTVGVISRGDRQAKEVIKECKKLINHGNYFMEQKYGKKKFFENLLDPNGAYNQEEITFKDETGSTNEFILAGAKSSPYIVSYPPTGKVLGQTFSLILLDEAGRAEAISDEFIKEDLLPTGSSTSAPMIMTSTPWEPSGYFYRVVDPDGEYGESPAKVLKYTIDALKHEPNGKDQFEFVQENEIKPLRRDGDHDAVRRAYYCEFVKGEKSFFDPEKVNEVFSENYEEFETFDGPCDIGVDWGGQTDSQTIVTVTMLDDEGCIYRLYRKEYGVQEDDNVLEDIENIVMKKFPQWQRIIPEYTPQSDYMVRKMEDKGWEVHRFIPRSDKMKKFAAFRSKVNKGEAKSLNDSKLKSEMKALQTNTGSRQSRIVAPRDSSDDRIDSWVMSAYFMIQDEGPKIGFVDFNST